MAMHHVAYEVLESGCCIASQQHIKQEELNDVAGLLTFAGSLTLARGKRHPLAADDPSDDALTQRFHPTTHPKQILPHFAITQLPDEILPWDLYMLQTTALSLIVNQKRVATKTMTGFVATRQPC
jgi:hypothetical protein